jgi:hypothetical protein
MSKTRHTPLSVYVVICLCVAAIIAGLLTWLIFSWDISEPIKPLCFGGGGLLVVIILWGLRKILIRLLK